MDVAKAAIETKITQVKVVESRTDDIIKQGNRERIERQHKTLKELVKPRSHCTRYQKNGLPIKFMLAVTLLQYIAV